jgi:oxygen-independent coproporphyrinogen-3 oxidase
MVKEIELRHVYLTDKTIQSIYFGGGTPSLLPAHYLEQVLNTLKRYYKWDSEAEITVEANPDDITKEKLVSWKKAGINRLSIGLQSFDDAELKWMNRAHTAAESVSSVKLAQDKGFDNITIDLIYGSKFQDLNGWERTVKKAVELNTQHISAYNLTIENKTVLGLLHSKGKEPAVNDKLSSRQFLMLSQMLSDAGFIHYEISNFGKEGYFAKHNSNYWRQQPYLGLGPSAHSFDGKTRQWNFPHNKRYVDALSAGNIFFEKEELSIKDLFNEYVLTRLRTSWGCDIDEMKKLFGEEMTRNFQKNIAQKKEYIEENKGVYTLNLKGKLMADGIASDLFVL